MTTPVMTVKPLFMRWIKLSITDGANVTHGFECAVTQAGLTSTGGDTQSLTTLCPEGSFSEAAERAWSLVVTGVQDVESAESLQMFLLQHDGEVASFVFYPKVDRNGLPVGNGFKGTVTLAPPDQVGNVASGQFATFQATLPLSGKYTIIDANGVVVKPAATGAVAGSPGYWLPTGAAVPASMAAAPLLTGQAVWVQNQYILVGTGTTSNIKWTGTAWAAYTGPLKSAAKNLDVFPAEPTITASDATNAAKLAGLGFVASPLTAWTTGQKMTVGIYDFNWSSTAWAAGAHA